MREVALYIQKSNPKRFCWKPEWQIITYMGVFQEDELNIGKLLSSCWPREIVHRLEQQVANPEHENNSCHLECFHERQLWLLIQDRQNASQTYSKNRKPDKFMHFESVILKFFYPFTHLLLRLKVREYRAPLKNVTFFGKRLRLLVKQTIRTIQNTEFRFQLITLHTGVHCPRPKII